MTNDADDIRGHDDTHQVALEFDLSMLRKRLRQSSTLDPFLRLTFFDLRHSRPTSGSHQEPRQVHRTGGQLCHQGPGHGFAISPQERYLNIFKGTFARSRWNLFCERD